MTSDLRLKYSFIPLIYNRPVRGLSLKAIKYYYSQIRAYNPDILHVRGSAIDGLNAIIAGRMSGNIKVLMTIHGMYSELIYINPIKKWISKFIVEPLNYHLSDGVNCVCDFMQKKEVGKGHSKKMLPIVYNRIPDWTKFDKQKIGNSFRSENNIGLNCIVGLYVGRINKEKGLEYLIEALIEISKDWPHNFKFIFVGDGQHLKKAKQALVTLSSQDRIIFTGEKEDVKEVYFASNFFVLPSLHENHSISLLEACAAGLPIITTQVGGNPEVVLDKSMGVLIPSKNSEVIAKSILVFLNKKGELSIMGENSKAYAMCKFNAELVDIQQDKVYKQLL